MRDFPDLVRETRSVRRFDVTAPVGPAAIRELVAVARLVPSAGNLQPLKYLLSADARRNDLIFGCLRWAARLEDWPGPAPEERPTAYIVLLGDTRVTASFGCDHGIAAQTIMLAARARGLGGCIVGSIDREGMRDALAIPPSYEILLVVALGVPVERVVLEDVGTDGDVSYRRDEAGVHHVPKRSLDEVIVEFATPDEAG